MNFCLAFPFGQSSEPSILMHSRKAVFAPFDRLRTGFDTLVASGAAEGG
jgi:hypothetical protein